MFRGLPAGRARRSVSERGDMFYFITTMFIIALRLWIWKLFPGLESGLKDDLSNMIIAALVCLLAVIFFTHKLVCREGLVKCGLEAPLALFIAAAAASVTWTADTGASFKALVMLLTHVFFFYILLDALSNEKRRRIFCWFFFAASLVVAALGINDIIILNQVSPEAMESARLTNKSLYYILTHKRACSLFGWPNVLAGFLMLAIPLAAALLMTARSLWARVIVGFGAVMLVMAFFFTFSFLGWMILLTTMAVVFVFLIYQRVIVIPAFAWKYLLVGVLVAAALFAGVIVKKDFSGSISPRKEYARVFRNVISENPFMGVGFGAYRYASFRFVTSMAAETAFPHNSYAQAWAETGLAGLAAILWLVVFSVMAGVRSLRRGSQGQEAFLVAAVFTGLLAFFADNVTSFTMLKPNIAFFFWVWLALFYSFILKHGPVGRIFQGFSRAVMIALIMAAAAGLFLSGRAALSLFALRDANIAAVAGVFDLARPLYEKAHALAPLDAGVLTAQGDLYMRAWRATGDSKWGALSQQSYVQAAAFSPNAYYNYLALASIYAGRGDQARSKALLDKARMVSPYETERDLEAMSRRK